jgi:hypothetical protein
MFGRKRRNERELLLRARIKELENIICPAEVHDWQLVSERFDVIDGYGTLMNSRRYVCKRCLLVRERTDFE